MLQKSAEFAAAPRAVAPRDDSFDSTLALLREGYALVSNRCRRYRTDIFRTRLMLRSAFCARGEEVARMFYHPDRFTRKGALPPMTLLLPDISSAVLLDGRPTAGASEC